MQKKRALIIFFALISFRCFAQSADLFLYIPTDDEMARYMSMHQFLRDWDEGKKTVDDKLLDALYANNVGKNTLNGLQFEAFLRATKNSGIRAAVTGYIDAKALADPFSTSLKKLYAAKELTAEVNGTDTCRYSYNDEEFDEDIDLFDFYETTMFDGKFGLLLFDNTWEQINLADGKSASEEPPTDAENTESDASAGPSIKSFYLITGGGTNTMTVYFKRYANIPESKIGETLASENNQAKYPDWKAFGLDAKGILASSGADKYIVAYGTGPDVLPGIDSGTFNAYCYDTATQTLYEMSSSMNFSPMNISYPARARIYNYILFNTLFCFLNK